MLSRLRQRLTALLETPAPSVRVYTTNGATLSGLLVETRGDRFYLAHASYTSPSGQTRDLRGRVGVLRGAIDFWTEV